MAVKKRGRKKAAVKTTKKVGRPAKKGGKKKATKKKTTAKKTAKKRKKSGKKAVKKTKKTAKKKGRKKKRIARQADKQGVTIPIVTPKLTRKKKASTPKTSTNSKLILAYLTENDIPFEIVKHSPTFTAQQTAASAHVSGKNIAKAVIVKIDGHLAIVVEPAHLKVDLDALRRQLNVDTVELASEAEFRHHFPDCELGAMPPLGQLYNMDVFVSDNLAHDEFIVFNAGTHAELVKMSYQDFYNLTHPKVVYA